LPPRVGWGKWKFGGIFNIGKNISILAKVTQVSDVAHGSLVYNFLGNDERLWLQFLL
jgi:hypothetical protein